MVAVGPTQAGDQGGLPPPRASGVGLEQRDTAVDLAFTGQ
jgi:hypothetical protein